MLSDMMWFFGKYVSLMWDFALKIIFNVIARMSMSMHFSLLFCDLIVQEKHYLPHVHNNLTSSLYCADQLWNVLWSPVLYGTIN